MSPSTPKSKERPKKLYSFTGMHSGFELNVSNLSSVGIWGLAVSVSARALKIWGWHLGWVANGRDSLG